MDSLDAGVVRRQLVVQGILLPSGPVLVFRVCDQNFHWRLKWQAPSLVEERSLGLGEGRELVSFFQEGRVLCIMEAVLLRPVREERVGGSVDFILVVDEVCVSVARQDPAVLLRLLAVRLPVS